MTTANQRAYEAIRDLIVTTQIRPGEMLNEVALGQRLGLGRAPVREAFKRLASDRMVVVYPRRGTFAADIQISDERWLSEVRGPLEGLAAELAARRRSKEDVVELEKLLERLHDLVGQAREDTDLDAHVHRTIFRLSRNPHLESTLNQYLNLAMRIWYYCMDRLPDVGPHVAVQQEVLQAIIAGDADHARTVASDHIHRFSEHVRDFL